VYILDVISSCVLILIIEKTYKVILLQSLTDGSVIVVRGVTT